MAKTKSNTESKAVVKDSKIKEEVKSKVEEKKEKKPKEIIVESASESDDDDITVVSDSQSDTGSDSEQEPQSDSGDEDKPITKKEKPKKLSHKELTTELIANEEKIQVIKEAISKHEDILKTIISEQNALRRTNLRLIKQLDKAHEDDVNKARKEKKKRNVTQDSGILKNKPIPPVLIKYLDLKQDTELPRTKVMSLLNNKFKELGLKKGQDTILDKKNAKIFGKDEGYIIEFKYFQRFLKNVYEEAGFKSTEVSL